MKRILVLVTLGLFQVCLFASTTSQAQKETRQTVRKPSRVTVYYPKEVVSGDEVYFRVETDFPVAIVLFYYREFAAVLSTDLEDDTMVPGKKIHQRIFRLPKVFKESDGHMKKGRNTYTLGIGSPNGAVDIKDITINFRESKMVK